MKHPDGKEGGDVVVEFAGSGLTVFIGYPSFYDGRGMVQAYSIINDTIVEKPDCSMNDMQHCKEVIWVIDLALISARMCMGISWSLVLMEAGSFEPLVLTQV